MKILVIKLSAIGDVIHSLPVADYLKTALPGCQVSWLIENASSDLVANNPSVDKVILFQGKKWLRNWSKLGEVGSSLKEVTSFFNGLRAEQFDAVIDLQGLLKSSLLGAATGCPLRVGFADTREFADRLLTAKLDVGDYFGHNVAVVELNLKLAQFLVSQLGHEAPPFKPRFPLPAISAERENAVEKLLSPLVVSTSSAVPTPRAAVGAPGCESPPSNSERKFVSALIPGTTWISKIWPTPKWIELGAALSRQYESEIVIIGGPSEVTVNSRLAADLRAELAKEKSATKVLDLTGQTSLLDLVALFDKVDLVIGGDTGPLHLAAAVQHPKVIGVFGATPSKRNGPYGEHCKTVALSLDCQPCYSKKCRIKTVACLTELAPSLVMDAVASLLN